MRWRVRDAFRHDPARPDPGPVIRVEVIGRVQRIGCRIGFGRISERIRR